MKNGKYQKILPARGGLGIILLVLGLTFITARVLAAVTLIDFSVEGQDGEVYVTWETASELDNAGFYINRSLQQDSGFARISHFIPAEGDDITGALYYYLDTEVTNGTAYWYKLESVDFSQNSFFYDPAVQAIPGITPTGTATAATRTATATAGTPTQTATPTVTGTAATSTATLTPTRTASSGGATPTRTVTQSSGYPGPATATTRPFFTATTAANVPGATLQATATQPALPLPQPGETFTTTATLLPLPEIELQFPDQTVTGTPGIAAAAAAGPAGPDADRQDGWSSPGRLFFILFIVLIWAVLGGWFFLSMRKIEK